MPTVFEIFEALEAEPSRLAKEAILKENKDNELLRDCFSAALDPYRQYGVTNFNKPVPVPVNQQSSTDGVVKNWLNLLTIFQRRINVGNAARTRIFEFFSACTALEQKWCERIITKNLRCGATEATVNKIWPKLIPKFEVQLAEEAKLDEVKYPVYVDRKIDGLRLIAFISQGTVTLMTRGGKEVETLPALTEALSKLVGDWVLDGEIYGGNWNDSQSVIHSSKTRKDDSKMVYNVFDAMSLAEWRSQNSLDFLSRQKLLMQLVQKIDSPLVVRVEGDIVVDEETLMLFHKKSLELGYEGTMLKTLDSSYKFGRGKNVTKLKPLSRWTGVVVGSYRGSKGGKWENEFGGFYVMVKGSKRPTQVGGGFSDEQRKTFLGAGVGRVVEVEGQELTKDGMIRFPVFVGFREEADLDSQTVYELKELVSYWMTRNG